MKRILCTLLALCMVLSCFPGAVFAAEEEHHESTDFHEQDNGYVETYSADAVAEDGEGNPEEDHLIILPKQGMQTDPDIPENGNISTDAIGPIRPNVSAAIRYWISTEGYGDAVQGDLVTGTRYYFNYNLYDSDSGRLWDYVSSDSYRVSISITNSSGSTIVGPYSDTDHSNWVSTIFNTAGTYYFRISITGDFSYSNSMSFTVRSGGSGSGTPELHSDRTSLSLSVGSSATVYFWRTGSYSGELFSCSSTNRNIADFGWGDKNSSGRWPLTVTGRAAGSATLTISYLHNDTREVLDTVTIPVTVGSSSSNCTISFSVSGGTGAPSSITAARGSSITIPSAVPASSTFGRAFAGWQARKSDGTTVTAYPGRSFTVTESLTFNAVWNDAEEIDMSDLWGSTTSTTRSKTINFANQEYFFYFTPGGTSSRSTVYRFEGTGSTDNQIYLYSSSGSLVDSDDDDGDGTQFLLNRSFSDNNRYYLKVRMYSTNTGSLPFRITCTTPPANRCTVSFSVSGGTGAPSSMSAQAGSSITIPSAVPTSSTFGRAFASWQARKSDGTTVTVYPGRSFTVTESLTFNAVWNEAEEIDMSDLWGSTTSMNLTKTINFANQEYFFYFTPGGTSSRSTVYRFEGTGSTDNKVYLYSSSGSQLAYDDDSSSNGNNFLLNRSFSDNNRYYLMVRMYSTNTGSLPFRITCTTPPANNCTISYVVEGGTGAPSSQTAQAGSSITIPSNIPTSSTFGRAFAGWEAEDSDGETVTVYPGRSFTVTESLQFHAVWNDAEELDLSELYGSSSYLSETCQVVFPNQEFFYSFNPGGSTSLPLSYTFTATGSSDDIAYLYNASGTQLASNDDGAGNHQFQISRTFSDNNLYYLKVRMLSSNTGTIPFRIVCTTTPPTETISYVAEGGTGAPSSQSARAGSTITIPSTIPTSTTFGRAFGGWEAEDSDGETVTVYPGDTLTVTESLQFHAIWNDAEELDLESIFGTDDTITSTQTVHFSNQCYYYVFTPGGSTSLPIQYLFLGTSSYDTKAYLYSSTGSQLAQDDDGGSNAQFRLSYTFSNDNTYYLMVRFYSDTTGTLSFRTSCLTEIPTYSVVLDDTFGNREEEEIVRGETMTIPDDIPFRPGKTFLGWGNSAGEVLYEPGDTFTVTADVTLYAIYRNPVNIAATTTVVEQAVTPVYAEGHYWFSYTPSLTTYYQFQALDEDLDTYIAIYSAGGDLLAQNDDDGEEVPFRVNLQLTASTTYYIGVAVYDEPADFSFLVDRGYRITYNANGGTGAPAQTYAYHEAGGTLSETVPTRTGRDFGGWATTATATSAAYSAGQHINVTANTTLYAVWTAASDCEHSYGDWTQTVPPTCTTEGREVRTCSLCGREEARTVSALGHDWADATCTAPKTCSRCRLTEGSALGHDWQDADCENPRHCSRCSATEGEALGHIWQNADCENPATCSRCHETVGDPLGHDWIDADCEHSSTCRRCGETTDGPLGHDWVDATCVTPKTCRRCRTTDGEALGHDWQDATCEDPISCSRCEETVGAPLGHDWADADCENPRSCTRCEATDGEPLGHDWVDADCENPKTCRRCEATDGEALGHDFVEGTCSRCGASEVNPSMPEGVIRLAGSDRYATGFAIANQLKENLGIRQFSAVVVAYGRNFPDALTGSYLASVKSAPILLIDPTVENQVLDYIGENLVPGGDVYILGGTSAVSNTFEVAARNSGFNVKRLKGAGRYETNLAILREAGIDPNDEILIATGGNYADSLSASATGLPMLLVDKTLTDGQRAFLQGTSKRFVILGGTGAVSAAIEAELNTIGTAIRVKGTNRYLTSVLIASKYFTNPQAAVLAYAQGFPDGLCGGPLAISMGAPLILTSNESPEAAGGYIRNISIGVVTGGTGRISDETVRYIFDLPYDTPINRE